MTTKEKARAYDEALKQIKECTPDENGFITIYPQEIFPELAESEDERVRKALVRFHKSTIDIDGIKGADIISWLEKQGKKLSIWTDSDRIMAFTLLRDVDQMTYISDEGKNERLQWLNSLEDKFNNGE